MTRPARIAIFVLYCVAYLVLVTLSVEILPGGMALKVTTFIVSTVAFWLGVGVLSCWIEKY